MHREARAMTLLAPLLFAAIPALPPDVDWSLKKRLLRERVAEVVAAGNALFGRHDARPGLVLDRLPGLHGSYDHEWNVMSLDLESIHDAEKFWHVYHVTIAHEWAHRLNGALHGARGHDEDFMQVLTALRRALHGGR